MKDIDFYIILKSTEDYQKMYIDTFNPNPKYQKQIALEFEKLVKEYNFTNSSNLSNLFVAYNDFSEEAKADANWSAIKEAKHFLKQKYCNDSLWHVEAEFSAVVVFYLRDSDIILNDKKGINGKVKLDYFNILKKYDELKYYTFDNFIIAFDSKENLDKNYEGNLFYYSRR